MIEYYISLDRTVAYEINEQRIKTVCFKSIQLGGVNEIHSELFVRKVGEHELLNIRASNYPCRLSDFEEVLNKAILFHVSIIHPECERLEDIELIFKKTKAS